MNVYDFDNTIYRGESTLDFFFFCVRRNKRLIRLIPPVLNALIRYKLCRITREQLSGYITEYAGEFSICSDRIEEMVKDFWDRNIHKIKPFYFKLRRESDLIISASFDFLLEEAFRRLNIKNYICSSFDFNTGELKRLCYSRSKAEIYRSIYKDTPIENFYTDSMNDKPLIDIADCAFIVRGSRIRCLKQRP